MNKYLKNIVVIGGMALGLSSCYDKKYDFDGFIGADSVSIDKQLTTPSHRVVQVFKEDDFLIEFYSSGKSGKENTDLQKVEVSKIHMHSDKDGLQIFYKTKTLSYSPKDERDSAVIRVARKQHEEYLNEVLEIKKDAGIEVLMK